MENNGAVKSSQNPFDIFVTGARKGFHIAIHNLMPNVVMAYVLAEVLNLLGIMPFLGQLFVPVMGGCSACWAWPTCRKNTGRC
jgi:spore maturation protein SpmB